MVLKRDLRIDLLKGIALIMVLVNHIGYVIPNSYYTFLTNKYYGFSDAAELFLFMSGYLFGRIYLRFYQTEGYYKTLIKAVHRNFQLYLWILIISIFVFAVYAFFDNNIGGDFINTNVTAKKFFENPFNSIPDLVVLKLSATYTNILRFYITVIFLGVLFIPILEYSYKLLLFISVSLYILSFWIQLTTYYDLFSWQLLFIVAMILGSKIEFSKNRYLLIIAISYLIISLIISLYAHFISSSQGALSAVIEYLMQKYPLSIFRVLHCLALFYVFNSFVDSNEKWKRNPFMAPILDMGRNSLEVYSFGVLIAHVSHIILIYFNKSFVIYSLEIFFGILLSAFFSAMVSWYKSKPWNKMRVSS